MAAVDGARARFLEDPDCPEKEALETLAGRLDSVSLLVVPPCSNRTLSVLLEKMPGLRRVFVLDHIPGRLRVWRESLDNRLRPLVSDSALPDLGAAGGETVRSSLFAFMPEMYQGKSAVYIPARFRRADPDFAAFLERTVLGAQREACSAAAHKSTRSWHKSMNRIINCGLRTVYRFADPPSGAKIPAVLIAGAGPSLDENIKVLKKHRGKVFVIACDAALNTFLDHGIKPDLAACTEDLLRNWIYFSRHAAGSDPAPLAAPIGCAFVIPENYPGKFIMTAAPQTDLPGVPGEAAGALPVVAEGLCVGHYALHLAESLRPEKIIMAGFDLAFRDGKFHSASTPMSYYRERPESFRIMEVEAYTGAPVKTDVSMSFYINYFGEKISASKIPVVNATGAGAKVRGAPAGDLDEILSGLPAAPKVNIRVNEEFIRAAAGSPVRDRSEKLRALGERASALERELSSMPSGARPVNLVASLPVREPEFELAVSACEPVLMSRFADMLSDLRPESHAEFRELQGRALAELALSARFFQTLLRVRDGWPHDPKKFLALVPAAGEEGRDLVLDLVRKHGMGFVPADTELTGVWEAAAGAKASALLCVNGAAIPDAWAVPRMKCVDIKTVFSPRPYESGLWIPGYTAAPVTPDLLERWRKFISSLVDCEPLEDILSSWLS
jgi:hypothetical protein